MEQILATLKVPKVEVLTLDKPFIHLFKDLISEILLVLIPLDLNKMNLEIILIGPNIFFIVKMKALSRKIKEMVDSGTPFILEKNPKRPQHTSSPPNDKLHHMEC